MIVSCVNDDGSIDNVEMSPFIVLHPEIETFNGIPGDTLALVIGVEGERAFQNLIVNKLRNGSLVESFPIIEDSEEDIFPPFHESYKYILEEEDIDQPFELEFRLDSRHQLSGGGGVSSFSRVTVLVITNE